MSRQELSEQCSVNKNLCLHTYVICLLIYNLSRIILIILCSRLDTGSVSKPAASRIWVAFANLVIVFFIMGVSQYAKNVESFMPFEISNELLLINYILCGLVIIVIAFLKPSNKKSKNET